MKINRLELCNYKGFKEIEFQFHEKLNLFVGVNGSGKSSVLDSMVLALSWLVNRIQRDRSNGSRIPEADLRNDADKGHIEISAAHLESEHSWLLTQTSRMAKREVGSYNGATSLAELVRELYHDKSLLPVIAYYPVTRTVDRIVPDIAGRDSVSILDVYENALSSKSNYRSLFEWFRHQDDILNEQALSRSYWMKDNKYWIRRKVNNILSALEELLSEDDSYIKGSFKHHIKILKDELFMEDPRILFMELSHFMHRFETKAFSKYEKAIHELEYMFHKMASLSKGFRDELIEDNEYFFNFIDRSIKSFIMPPGPHLRSSNNSFKQPPKFIWETFSFAILLSLWWISKKGLGKVEKFLRQTFHQGFYPVEFGYGLKVDEQFTNQLREIVKEEINSKQQIKGNQGKEFHFVRQAIEAFIPEYYNLQVKRVPHPRMELTKNGEVFDLNQLSDGEKNLIALIGDIARRLTMGNPNMRNPLEGEGIILIDEIDLHLHPKWQRIVAERITEIFPNCQFFISTHSPQVISHLKPESIFILQNIDNQIQVMRPEETYGMSIDRVVELIMDDYARADKPRKDLDKLFELIERNKIDEAKLLLSSLKMDMKTDPDIMRSEMMIRMKERQ